MKPHLRERFFLHAESLPTPLPGWEHHAHSTHSDGKRSLGEMADAALAAGLTRLVFTEHTEPELVQGPGWFGRYLFDLRQVQRRLAGALEMIPGLEVPILGPDGALELDSQMEEQAEFLLGAVHAYPGYGLAGRHVPPEEAIDLETRLLLKLLDDPRIDALAHPGGVCHLYVTPFPMERFEAVVHKAVRQGVAIELNPAYQNPMAPYLEICRRHGAMISPGSNAHAPRQLGEAWRILAALA